MSEKLGNRRVTGTEQYYTPASLADQLTQRALQLIPDWKTKTFLEPAGGTGSFVNALEKLGATSVISVDTEPKHPSVQRHNFLDFELEVDVLQGFTTLDGERRSQCLMPFDDFIYARFQRRYIQCTLDPISARHVVCRITRCYLINHPHLVLGKRQWGEITVGPSRYFRTSDSLVRSPLQALLQQRLLDW